MSKAIEEGDMKYYIVVHRKLKQVKYKEWIKWFSSYNTQIKKTRFGDCSVSTVFLGLSYGDDPLLYETMVIGGARDEEEVRDKTMDEAIYTHNRIVSEINEKIEQKQYKVPDERCTSHIATRLEQKMQ